VVYLEKPQLFFGNLKRFAQSRALDFEAVAATG
jgi:hypothetical protein